MIRATNLSYQNFLSAGNAPIVVNLDKHQTTLIVGRNGSGKSSMTDAICFAWFGRPLRNINKPTVVNSINGRDCLVELEFTTNAGHFKVRRGIKPTIFEIYRNGVLEPVPADLKEYQTYLEDTILKLNYKTFMQVVVLGSASYTPFMQLTALARRSIIEDLLDIQIFSVMSSLVKDDLSTLKAAIDSTNVTRHMLQEQLTLALKYEAQKTQDQQERLHDIQELLAATTAQVRVLKGDWNRLQTEYQALEPKKSLFDGLSSDVNDYNVKLARLESRTQLIESDITKFQELSVCPTCTQSVNDTFKAERIATLKNDCDTLYRAISTLTKDKATAVAQMAELDTALVSMTTINQTLTEIKTKVPLLAQRMKELKAESVRIAQQQLPSASAPDVTDIQTRLSDAQTAQTTQSAERVILDASVMLLKDNGIKTRVVQHYLPIINQYVNQYLTALDLPIHFTFDDQFNEVMKSRHRDTFSYENFSEGEKKRIDIALLFTWRAIARLKNSADVNLLILDEVFDGSLDFAGMDDFLKVLNTLETSTRIFVISHRDLLIDRFINVYTFEKIQGFTQYR